MRFSMRVSPMVSISRAAKLQAAALVVAFAALWQIGSAGLIAGKAWLAPILIADAWTETLATGAPQKPWFWADTVPVARLGVPEFGLTRYVMEGDNMRSLAFGPVKAGGAQAQIIFGHRDTHFAFLKDLQNGHQLTYQRADGTIVRYKVEASWVANKDAMYMPGGMPRSALLLVTCFPFGAAYAGGDQRYIVLAKLESPPL